MILCCLPVVYRCDSIAAGGPCVTLCMCAVRLLLCRVCCSVRRLSVEQLIAEDAALEKSCTDALSFVRTCEQLRGYNKQVQPGPVSAHTAGLWVFGRWCGFNNSIRHQVVLCGETHVGRACMHALLSPVVHQQFGSRMWP